MMAPTVVMALRQLSGRKHMIMGINYDLLEIDVCAYL
jgi:hypothetical protein